LYDQFRKSHRQFAHFHSMATAWPDKDDHELLALIQDGNGQAFAVLVERHTNRFYRLAYRYLQSKAAAEDVVQDAFVKIWENPALWQPERNSKFTTWFYRIVVNLCLDMRKRKRQVALDDAIQLVDEREPVDETMMRAQEQKILEKEIAALPERQQTALNLCFDEGLSNQEAAEIMGLKLKALQSLIMRAKTTLKERMKAIV
jgi:RNA polymerase sigma-70 factor (ECF subfamily)